MLNKQRFVNFHTFRVTKSFDAEVREYIDKHGMTISEFYRNGARLLMKEQEDGPDDERQ